MHPCFWLQDRLYLFTLVLRHTRSVKLQGRRSHYGFHVVGKLLQLLEDDLKVVKRVNIEMTQVGLHILLKPINDAP